MSLVEIKIDDAECLRVMDMIFNKVEHREPLMNEIAGIMHDAVEENFEKEGRPGKWALLAKSTIRQRKAKGHWPGKILQVRGRLAASIQTRADNNNAAVGTNVVYAKIQHFGGATKHAARQRTLHFSGKRFSKPKKANRILWVSGKAYEATIPARPFLHLEPVDLQKILTAARSFYAKAY
jgi:phage virion morphogenesis protein